MIEMVGILGATCYLLAFGEVTVGKWNGKSFWYETSNLMGAILLGFYSYHKLAYTNLVLDIVWASVALYGIRHIVIRHAHRKKARRKRR